MSMLSVDTINLPLPLPYFKRICIFANGSPTVHMKQEKFHHQTSQTDDKFVIDTISISFYLRRVLAVSHIAYVLGHYNSSTNGHYTEFISCGNGQNSGNHLAKSINRIINGGS